MIFTSYFDGLQPRVEAQCRRKVQPSFRAETPEEALRQLLEHAKTEERRLFNEHANAQLRRENVAAKLRSVETR